MSFNNKEYNMTEEQEKEHSGLIGIDLDGTIAKYDTWKGPEHIGEPIQPMIENIKKLMELDVPPKIVIFTARVSGEDEQANAEQTKYIQDWLEAQGLPRFDVTCKKTFDMVEYWDDRAVTILQNQGVPLPVVLNQTQQALGLAVQLLVQNQVKVPSQAIDLFAACGIPVHGGTTQSEGGIIIPG